jgi:hypothetical protein
MITSTKASKKFVISRQPRLAIAAALGGLIISCGLIGGELNHAYAAPAKAPAKMALDATGVPSTAAAAAYAWSLFTYAVSPSTGPGGTRTFENWTEQCAFNVGCPTPAAKAAAGKATLASGIKNVRQASGSRIHGKLPRALNAALNASAATNRTDTSVSCTKLTTPTAYPNVLPPQVVGQLFCEEVYSNPAETAFINANGLASLTGQAAYAAANGNKISLPWNAIELKVDWVTLSTLSTANCTSTTLYTEIIQFSGQSAQCFAMVGMHVSSKVLPNWLWATFEPANSPANPNRCNPALYGQCFDPFGTTSAVPYGMTNPAPQSPALASMMKSAKLPAVFNNYFLTGVQTQFVDSSGTATQLGNSFVEYWAGVAPAQASCITCHSYAILQTNPPTEIGTGGPAGPPIGPGATVQAGQVQQDFSWMLAFMPTTAAPKAVVKKK